MIVWVTIVYETAKDMAVRFQIGRRESSNVTDGWSYKLTTEEARQLVTELQAALAKVER